MKLLTPFKKENTIVHRVAIGESLTDVATAYGVTVWRLVKNNGTTERPRANSILFIEKGGRLYEIKIGDTPSSIAARFKVNEEELLRLNGENAFFPFSVIEIP